MEISNPDAPRGPWYVTNGLLVVELITGRMQMGHNAFAQYYAAGIPVAGDADDTSGPTYAALANLLDDEPLAVGTEISWRIDHTGNVTTAYALTGHGVTAAFYDSATYHTIAAPFWIFMNSSGMVWENGSYTSNLLFEDPFYATGRPITEAYWATVKVAGAEQDVLLQCFERRCLTYTPRNADGWKVEASNVGQHYYAWRYGQSSPPYGQLEPPYGQPAPSPDPGYGDSGDLYQAGAAGKVEIRRDYDRLILVAVYPNPGWAHEVESSHGREIEVDFKRSNREIKFDAELHDGQLRIRVCDETDDDTRDLYVVEDAGEIYQYGYELQHDNDDGDDDNSGPGNGDNDDDDDDNSGPGNGDDDDNHDDDKTRVCTVSMYN
ncbi:MAG: hypothetical protein H0V47_16300 [Chloroflexia bacterium]|nr:hypothetical protein [Chloroflexia bacterium]